MPSRDDKLERLRGLGVSATTNPNLHERDWVEIGRLADEGGYGSFWSTEDTGREAFGYLGALAMKTNRALLGTAVVNTYSRSAPLLAQAITTLDQLSEGRAVLGLGLGNPRTARSWHAPTLDKPADRIRDYLGVIHAASHGQDEYVGTAVSVRHLSMLTQPRTPWPILIGSSQPDVLDSAVNYIDGWMPSGAPELIEQHRARFTSKLIIAYTMTSANPDRVIALDAIRRQVAAYATRVPYLRKRYERDLGIDRVDRLISLVRQGKERDAIRLIPDDYIERMAIAGTPEECRLRVQDYLDAGADGVILGLTRFASADELTATVNLMAPRKKASIG
jgi:alkanesulfonate monooxygenase SsuD/methylene tetrahydromethanopterin reductase-like flavin-dependent oxidoreductase (luciferase family)